MPTTLEPHQLSAADQAGEHLGVGRRHHHIGGALENQGGCGNPAQAGAGVVVSDRLPLSLKDPRSHRVTRAPFDGVIDDLGMSRAPGRFVEGRAGDSIGGGGVLGVSTKQPTGDFRISADC